MRALIALLTFLPLSLQAAPALDCETQTQLEVTRIDRRLVVIGEIHGNAQTAAFVGGLVCSLLKDGRAVLLALEKDGMEQAALNRYLVSAGTATDRQALLSQGAWTWPMQDGRASQAVLALIEDIRRMRGAGYPVGLLAIVQSWGVNMPRDKGMPQQSEADRRLSSLIHERAMADKLAAASAMAPGATVVALVGNTHTSTVARHDDDPQWLSMAQWLLTMRPAFFIGLGSTEGGDSWACTVKGCGPMKIGRGPHYEVGTQIDAVVRLGPITASTPAVPQSAVRE